MGKRLYSEKREKFRALLKQARMEAGLTQVQMADKLKRHQSYVSDYERGHRRLDWVATHDILEVCGQSLTQFSKRYVEATSKTKATD